MADEISAPSSPSHIAAPVSTRTTPPAVNRIDRGIRIAAHPGRSKSRPQTPNFDPDRPSSSDAAMILPSSSSSTSGVKPQVRVMGKPSKAEGVIAKIADWMDGSMYRTSPRSRPIRDPPPRPGAPPEFTATTEDPDKRRINGSKKQAATAGSTAVTRRSLEDQWRSECLAAARSRSLRHVQEMKFAQLAPEFNHKHNYSVVLLLGGHYNGRAVSKEDLLLHCVQEFERLGSKQFVVVYLNADAPLHMLPDTVFFTELHAALPANHRRRLHAIYILHPTAAIKGWMFLLRLQEPSVYSKVVYLERLWQLGDYFLPGYEQSIPDFVQDYDRRRQR